MKRGAQSLATSQTPKTMFNLEEQPMIQNQTLALGSERPIIFVVAFLGLIASSTAMMTPLSAYARDRGDHQMTIAIAKQELRQITVTLKGAVTCTEASGTACHLNLKDVATGQTYKLSNASEVLKLYNAGTQNVVIEGILKSSDEINVISVQSI
jgi:hypothetical protein